MKVSKNNFDIALYPVSSCNVCAFGSCTKNCYWLPVFKKASLTCGGVTTVKLSDIFKL